MKKLFGVTFLFLILCFSSNAKILNVGFHNLEVPKNFYLKKLDNINFLEDMCQEFSTCYGIMSKKMKEIIDELESGESLENIEILKPIMKKIKNLEQGSYEQSGKKLKSLMTTIKRTMKKHQSNMMFDYYAGDSSAEDHLNISDYGYSMDEIRTMKRTELDSLAKEIRDEISEGGSFFGIDGLSAKFTKFNISKSPNGEPYLLGEAKIKYFLIDTIIHGDIAFYMSEYEGKIFAFDGYCLVDCSKFYSTFNQIVNDSFHKQAASITSTTSTDNDFINQLKQLNTLYKSGVITKEEFEKAKKKVLKY